MTKGWCGDPIQVQCDITEIRGPLLIVGRFELGDMSTISIGDKINTDTITNNLVSEQNKQATWWPVCDMWYVYVVCDM
jgi:hypothetical protein